MSASRTSLVRRSNSCLSSLGGGEKTREPSFESTNTYLTPTQRKNQELKRCRADLAKANERIEAKELEIRGLQRKLCTLAEIEEGSGNRTRTDQQATETGSVTDSGNCEELSVSLGLLDQDIHQEEEGGDNIDFELMEAALREEEEARHKLEEENRLLRGQLGNMITKLTIIQADWDAKVEEERLSHDLQLERLKAATEEPTSVKDNENKMCHGDCQGTREEFCVTNGLEKELFPNLENELQLKLEQEISQNIEKDVRIKKLTEILEKEKKEKLETEKKSLKEEEKNKQLEELVAELGATSIRCVRQQELIEQQQHKLNTLSAELNVSSKKKMEGKADLTDETQQISLQEIKSRASEAVNHNKPITSQTVGDKTCQTGDLSNTGGLEEVNLQEETVDPKTHYTLQFLRRSVYYYLIDKENRTYHLKSIERLLEFNEVEREAIGHGRKRVPGSERY